MLYRVVKNWGLSFCSAGTLSAAFLPFFGTEIALQDVASLTKSNIETNRHLASVVAKPERFSLPGEAGSDRVRRVILSSTDLTPLGVTSARRIGPFTGYAFVADPAAAMILSEDRAPLRSAKGDRPASAPVKVASRSRLEVKAHIVAKLASKLERRAEEKTARSAPVQTAHAGAAVAGASDDEPLALIPQAAIKKIEREIAEAGDTSGETLASALTANGIDQTVTGYAAPRGDSPKAIFEAILGDNKKAQEKPELPLSAALDDEDADRPMPRIKPEVVAEAEPKKKRKGMHFWAYFKLPNSTFKRNQQRCLAAGIYFEARGEPERGQAAVAQVILNRVKNPTYPKTICGVVYQNKHWRNRCQFSFACDGIYDRINDKKAWDRAIRIARDVSKGRTYLDDVGDSTHYHATYVNPKWARKMNIVARIGVHIFYRTKKGGWI
ncbi:MAG: cell wall hydrolase [Pseudomonadota bacterium]